MDALTVYRRLHDAGVGIATNGDKLIASPATRLTNELRTLIRQHKPELLVLVTAAQETTAKLLDAAVKVCDRHNDEPEARRQMRRECLELPPHLQRDLLAHFKGTS